MPFKPGQSGNPHGRKPGTQNKLTRTVKEAFEAAFNSLQEPNTDGTPSKASLPVWAKDHPKEFYQLAKVLIPTKLEADIGGLIVNLTTGVPKESEDDCDIA